MRFQDMYVFREERFSVGHDTATGAYYLSFPVNNGLVEYEEYYAIARDWAEYPAQHMLELRTFAEKARAHEMDDRILQQPGRLRGEPV